MRKLAVILISLFMLGAGLTVALPSTAAMSGNCTVSPQKPYTNGNYVYSKTVVKCEHTVPIWVRAVSAGSINQMKVAFIWTAKGEWKYTNTAPQYTISHTTSFRCNGLGTDVWRNRGFGQDENNGETYKNSADQSLTC